MEKPLQKISRVIIQPVRDLQLRIHVKLLNEKDGRVENFHNVFEYGNNKYGKVDLQSFLTLDYSGGDKSNWQSKSIMINQKNIFQVITGFEKMRKAILDDDVFAVNAKGESVIYKKENAEKSVQRIYNLGNNNRLVISPAIIFDEEANKTYEGVILYINKTENYVELPIDAFEALYYALKQVNLFVYSQLLVNYYLASVGAELESKPSTETEVKKKPRSNSHILVSEERVTSTLPKKEDTFLGLESEK